MLLRISAFLLLLLPSLAGASSSGALVELAFRDAASAQESERRTVVLQAQRDQGAFRFDAACGRSGQACECSFFRTAGDLNPLRGTGLGVSTPNNSLSCLIPGSQSTPDLIHFVQVRLRTGESITSLVPVKTALTIDDVLGNLAKTRVRGIFRYSCNRTFFEGEGVSQGQISCIAGQHLGVISATYNFYTFKSGEDSNSGSGDFGFSSDVCRRNSFLRIQCTGNTPNLRFGLYKEIADPFVVGIQLTRAPEAFEGDTAPLTSNYGYAALPDENGHCPLGLVKARPYVAQAASIVKGSIDGKNPPSNFINSGNSLNNTVIETIQPPAFPVLRQPNTTPCDGAGDCTAASFGAVQAVQSVRYTPLTPVVCVIPPQLINDLF